MNCNGHLAVAGGPEGGTTWKIEIGDRDIAMREALHCIA